MCCRGSDSLHDISERAAAPLGSVPPGPHPRARPPGYNPQRPKKNPNTFAVLGDGGVPGPPLHGAAGPPGPPQREEKGDLFTFPRPSHVAAAARAVPASSPQTRKPRQPRAAAGSESVADRRECHGLRRRIIGLPGRCPRVVFKLAVTVGVPGRNRTRKFRVSPPRAGASSVHGFPSPN